MNCRTFESLLADYVDARLTASQRAAVDDHLAGCERCHAVAASLRSDAHAPSADEAFVAEILARTTGSPCGRAETLMSAFVEGLLGAADAALVAGHMHHCSGCRVLAETLQTLAIPLREMAAIEPDQDFVTDVLRATTRPQPRVQLRPAPWSERLRAGWQQLVLRPRFALEGAYIGTAVLILLFGTPLSPLDDAPARAISLATINPMGIVQPYSRELGDLGEGVLTFGDRVWKGSGAVLIEGARAKSGAISEELDAFEATLDLLRDDLGRLRGAVFSGDLVGAAAELQRLGADLKSGTTGRDPEDNS